MGVLLIVPLPFVGLPATVVAVIALQRCLENREYARLSATAVAVYIAAVGYLVSPFSTWSAAFFAVVASWLFTPCLGIGENKAPWERLLSPRVLDVLVAAALTAAQVAAQLEFARGVAAFLKSFANGSG